MLSVLSNFLKLNVLISRFFQMLENAIHLFRVAVRLNLKGRKTHGKGWILDILLIQLEATGLIALNRSRHGVESGFTRSKPF